MQQFTIGADPEIPLRDSFGNFVSAHSLLPGSKQNPHPVHKGAIQPDGMMAEFNIDPANSYAEFVENLTAVQEQLMDYVSPYEVMESASVNFSQQFLDEVPFKHKVLGCEADYSAWTMQDNVKPDANSLMRTAGGHIHIGLKSLETNNVGDWKHFKDCARMARILDRTVGLPSLFWDYDDSRRSMYGQAGCFRPKTYGMEYRTLSNKWLFGEETVQKVYNGVELAVELFLLGVDEVDDQIQQIINNSDRNNEIMKEYKHECA